MELKEENTKPKITGQILRPREKIATEGQIAYSEGFQAWNVIRLKKEIFSEFPELKEKRSKFSYKLIYHRDVEKALKDLKEAGEVLPLFLFLYKDRG